MMRRVASVFVVLCAAMTTTDRAAAQTLTTLYGFCSVGPSCADGMLPTALIQATDGDFYGATSSGGSNGGNGTVFRITPTGTLTTLFSFNGTDGSDPSALTQADNGKFYGTTSAGGLGPFPGYGTAYEMTARGVLTTLHAFCGEGDCLDGNRPDTGVIQASNGDLYGTTFMGGVPQGTCAAAGTIFKMTPSGALITVFSFGGMNSTPTCGETGTLPLGVFQAFDGEIYGTTSYGGDPAYPPTDGTIFAITPGGALTTLYSFCSLMACSGGVPFPTLVQASNGAFYGATFDDGANNKGSVFKLTNAGVLTTLYSFCSQSNCADGANPVGALIQASDGNFYGTTQVSGGSFIGAGTLFRITPAGDFTTLYTFCSVVSSGKCLDGTNPSTTLLQATDGDIYGTTMGGGPGNGGTLFRLSLDLAPFIKTLTTVGKAGASVRILGNALTGSSSVMFNGAPASFKVLSSSEILATVPTAATTGIVRVTTLNSVLSSTIPFRIL